MMRSSTRSPVILLLFLLTIPKFSKPCIQLLDGWKQLSPGERAKLVKVVFIGKVVNLYSYDATSTHAADFEVWKILKGSKFVEEVLETQSSPLVKVYGFGEKMNCFSPVNPGEVHMVFMVYANESRALIARYDDIFGATAPATAKNEEEVLLALGWKTWSSWSRCNKNCDGGEQFRTRVCVNKECDGSSRESRKCNEFECYGLKDIARHIREDQIPPLSRHDNIKVENGVIKSIPVSKVFRYYNYFPDDFSMLFRFRVVALTNIYLVAMYDYRKSLSLGVRITPDLVSFGFEKSSLFQFRGWSLDFPVRVKTDYWHTLGISIQERNVTAYWDCARIGSKTLREKFTLAMDAMDKISIGEPVLVSSIERYEIEISELYFVPDPGASRQQCDPPIFKPVFHTHEIEGSGGVSASEIYGKEGSVEISWSEWSPCSKTCGKGKRMRVMMCDMENRFFDDKGQPTLKDECFKAIQTFEEKECYLQDCPAQCDRSCLNGGFCSGRNICRCQPGYHGDVCEKVECKIHCRNGGTCVGPYKCKCPSGYGGTQCEKVLCNPPCQYGGRCVKPNVCDCLPGFVGPYCRLSCSPHCYNGGVCVGPNKCRCAKGFTGESCLQAICNPPCMNFGVCYKPNTCSCPYGWHGKRCEKAQCYPHCRNGGTCWRRNTCRCPQGYYGNYCEHSLARINKHDDKKNFQEKLLQFPRGRRL
ncbi:uncharacterized protein LOC111332994 isoform X2 [Stylophora pistillata]|uniref:uncharacterized protein LOC111332994 isoform X2 n=1 Tax=Stylophora pistillata TaxID=50429 RepID=UPI000C04ED85|nr:uncharacterized protein LOC111332994 isoform X2 [Stylophora pistillata]